MKRTCLHFVIMLFLIPKIGYTQSLYNGDRIAIKGTASLFISGNFTNASGATYLNDATVEIKGNIENNQSSMSPGSGSTTLSGNSSQNISGSQPFEANNISFNNSSSGSDNIILTNNNIAITGSATFTDGITKTGTNKIIFRNGSSHSGGSDNSHINGWVEKIGNSTFTFPVGDATKLRTASISAPSIATDAFTAKYFRSDPDGTHSISAIDASLNHISRCEYWTINQTVGSSNPVVTLSFENDYSCGISSLTDLRVTYWNGSLWANNGNGATTGNTTSGTITASSSPTSWSEFTLSSSTTQNILPIELANFSALYNNANKNVDLFWTTLSESNSDYFEIDRSSDGTNWTKVSIVKASGFSNTQIDYSAQDLNPSLGINYYRLKEVDFDGIGYYSSIVTVNINQSISDLSIFPNPFREQMTINYHSEDDQQKNLIIRNIFGQIALTMIIDSEIGDNTVNIEAEMIPAGVYTLEIISKNTSISEKTKIIKIK